MQCAGRPTARQAVRRIGGAPQAVRRGRDGPPGSGGRGRCGGDTLAARYPLVGAAASTRSVRRSQESPDTSH